MIRAALLITLMTLLSGCSGVPLVPGI